MNNNKSFSPYIAIACLCAGLSSCVTTGSNAPSQTTSSNNVCDYNDAAFVGGGAVIGAGIGRLFSNNNRTLGTLIGAVAGGFTGKIVQTYFEDRCKGLAAAQEKMRVTQVKAQKIIVSPSTTWNNPDETTPKADDVTGLSINMESTEMFLVGQSKMTPQGKRDMQALAQAFKGSENKILIVGHTDASGSTEMNQTLSEQRAQYVSRIFKNEGIPESSLYFKGAGETDPITSNDNELGRAKNRRVEIVELPHEKAIVAYEFQRDNEIPSSTSSSKVMRDTNLANVKPLPVGLKTIDFGGVPVLTQTANLSSQVGDLKEDSNFFNFSFISEAYGNTEKPNDINTACIATKYMKRGEVKNLSSGEAIAQHKVSDHMPGLYETSWVDDNVNGHLVGITHVAVLRDSAIVSHDPSLFVFENYVPGNTKKTLEAKAKAEATIGEKGILYRAFFTDKTSPLICMDIVFAHKDQKKTSYGKLFYNKNGKAFAANFTPRLIQK
jgi:outer membrane protein OmpA-like peptidoglycan-associated protein